MNAPDIDTTPRPSPLERAARPLLSLAGNLSGLESTFVTTIDGDARSQTVLYSSNRGVLDVVAGEILSGITIESADAITLSAMPWAAAQQIRTLVGVPILDRAVPIGLLCGASRGKVVLDATQREGFRLLADALQPLLAIERDTALVHARAEAAERAADEARRAAKRHAVHSQQMERLAHTDALTGLPNRRAFMTRWETELKRSSRGDYAVGLMLLDADRFKNVNDTEGHAMGDAVLRAIGATLMVVVRPPDVAARLGGDEFALLTTRTDSIHLETLAAKIGEQFQLVARELGVDTTLSIGMVSSEHCPPERMLADADKALYRSKGAGGNASRMFRCDEAEEDTPASARTVRASGSDRR
jgi:diguanylate cyclase